MDWNKLYPRGVRRDIVIDTDADNETDDQYALAWALLNPDDFRLRAIYAAPFLNFRCLNAGEGMRKSYDEIRRLLSMFPERDVPVYPGARRFLTGAPPVPNPAADHLIACSREYTPDHPLRIVAIAAITNIAAALRLDPTLAERCELFWLGGQRYGRSAEEFNFAGDPDATATVLASGMPVALFPCAGVAETLRLSLKRAKEAVRPQGALGRFLYSRLARMVCDDPEGASPIWDFAPFFALNRPEWMTMEYLPRRRLDVRGWRWEEETGGAWWMNGAIDVEAAYAEFFAKLAERHARFPHLREPEF